MTAARDPKKVKSAQRTLEVLEYFAADRQQATVMEIARHLGYPQSSTSELLGCLVSLGYLHHDRYARTYRPSSRVAVLGSWVQPTFFRHGRLLPMMDELAEATGLRVILAIKVELAVRYVQVVAPPAASPETEHRETAPLLRSALGLALLSTHDRELVRRYVHRLNAETGTEMRLNADDFLKRLKEVRTQGYAAETEDHGERSIGVLLPQALRHEQLAVAIQGPAEHVIAHQDMILQTLRGAVARYLGPVAVTGEAAQAPVPAQMHRREEATFSRAV